MGSKPWSVDWSDFFAVLKWAGLSAAISASTYLIDHIDEAGLGVWAVIATSALTSLLVFLKQLRTDNSK